MFLQFVSMFGLWLTTITNAPPNVILITLDGVRWQEMFEGTDAAKYSHPKQLLARELAPNIYSYFVDNGMAFGKSSDVVVSNPSYKSLPGYLEMVRGYPTVDCQDNNCNLKTHTITDNLIEKDKTANIGIFSSWPGIAGATGTHRNKITLNIGNGLTYRSDRETQIVAFDYLRKYNPKFLWISLGDTDEYAHQGDYDQYIAAIRSADIFIGNLLYHLIMNNSNTTVILTTDHGRGKDWRHHSWDRNAKKVWLMMFGAKIPRVGFVKTKETISLSNIYPTTMDVFYNTNDKRSLLRK